MMNQKGMKELLMANPGSVVSWEAGTVVSDRADTESSINFIQVLVMD